MNKLLLHPSTQEQLDRYLRKPTHALLIIGQSGSGRGSLARQLAENVLGLAESKLDDYPYHLHLEPVKNSIGIETVRQLEHFLSLQVPRAAAYNRAVIVEQADLMTTEAQNALLKTLEEPPAATVLLLTASDEQAVLPTIRSRVQLLTVQSPSRDQIKQYFERDFDARAVQQAYSISAGLPGLMSALLNDEAHPLLVATELARQWLSQPQFNRLLLVDELAKQRDQARQMIGILQQMARLSLRSASGPAAHRWQAILEAGYQAQQALDANAQPKLALTHLALSF